jgi:hypothetical protein
MSEGVTMTKRPRRTFAAPRAGRTRRRDEHLPARRHLRLQFLEPVLHEVDVREGRQWRDRPQLHDEEPLARVVQPVRKRTPMRLGEVAVWS